MSRAPYDPQRREDWQHGYYAGLEDGSPKDAPIGLAVAAVMGVVAAVAFILGAWLL